MQKPKTGLAQVLPKEGTWAKLSMVLPVSVRLECFPLTLLSVGFPTLESVLDLNLNLICGHPKLGAALLTPSSSTSAALCFFYTGPEVAKIKAVEK